VTFKKVMAMGLLVTGVLVVLALAYASYVVMGGPADVQSSTRIKRTAA